MKPIRIFLVEDNEADAELVAEVFRRLNILCEIEHHDTVQRALAAVAGYSPDCEPIDLILLDHNLPGGNGLDVLAAIAQNPYFTIVPKAILSSFVLPEDLRKAEELGAHVVISKPITLDEFVHEIESKVSNLIAGKLQAAKQRS